MKSLILIASLMLLATNTVFAQDTEKTTEQVETSEFYPEETPEFYPEGTYLAEYLQAYGITKQMVLNLVETLRISGRLQEAVEYTKNNLDENQLANFTEAQLEERAAKMIIISDIASQHQQREQEAKVRKEELLQKLAKTPDLVTKRQKKNEEKHFPKYLSMLEFNDKFKQKLASLFPFSYLVYQYNKNEGFTPQDYLNFFNEYGMEMNPNHFANCKANKSSTSVGSGLYDLQESPNSIVFSCAYTDMVPCDSAQEKAMMENNKNRPNISDPHQKPELCPQEAAYDFTVSYGEYLMLAYVMNLGQYGKQYHQIPNLYILPLNLWYKNPKDKEKVTLNLNINACANEELEFCNQSRKFELTRDQMGYNVDKEPIILRINDINSEFYTYKTKYLKDGLSHKHKTTNKISTIIGQFFNSLLNSKRIPQVIRSKDNEQSYRAVFSLTSETSTPTAWGLWSNTDVVEILKPTEQYFGYMDQENTPQLQRWTDEYFKRNHMEEFLTQTQGEETVFDKVGRRRKHAIYKMFSRFQVHRITNADESVILEYLLLAK